MKKSPLDSSEELVAFPADNGIRLLKPDSKEHFFIHLMAKSFYLMWEIFLIYPLVFSLETLIIIF